MNSEVAILQLMHARGIGPRMLTRILKRLAHEQYLVHEFVLAPETQLREEYSLSNEIISGIRTGREKAEQLAQELDSRDIRTLYRGGPDYPMKLINVLADYAPPVLFGIGNVDLLNMTSVGFCGSRKSSQTSINAVSKCASALSSHSVNIVSGYAKGIDQAAHTTALQNGGTTTIVLATGILHFEVKQSVAPWINESNCLVLSEFLPLLGWTVHNAMQRNKTICGLSDAMVIVESSLKGGTFEAGKTALELARPVFVVEYQPESISPEGNRYFLDHGAKSLRAMQDGGVGVNRLLRVLEDSHLPPGQQKLFE